MMVRGLGGVMARKLIFVVSLISSLIISGSVLGSDRDLATSVVRQLEFQKYYDVMTKELASIRSATLKGLQMSEERAKDYNQQEQAEKFNALLSKAVQSKAFNRQVSEIEQHLIAQIIKHYTEEELEALLDKSNDDVQWTNLSEKMSVIANEEINQSIKEAARESKYYMQAVIAIYDE